jgi:hypothetical protein
VPDVVKNSIKNTSWYQELEGRDLEGLSKEIILGKYYGRVTPEGTVINLALCFTGLDFILDARDLFYDITHWENSMDHVKETGLDFISLAPGFGAIKYSDEAAELISAGRKGLKAAESTSTIGKKINNATELSTTLVKNSDEMGELAGAATKSIKNTKEAAKVTANSGSEIIDSTGTAIKNGNITAEANKVAVNSGDELTEVSTKITKNNEKIIKGTSKTINASDLKMSKTVQNHINDIVKKGPYKGELARPYIDLNGTTLLIDEIMQAGTPVKDTVLKNGLRWDVQGTFRGSTGTWELVVDTSTNTIVHFNFVAK